MNKNSSFYLKQISLLISLQRTDKIQLKVISYNISGCVSTQMVINSVLMNTLPF